MRPTRTSPHSPRLWTTWRDELIKHTHSPCSHTQTHTQTHTDTHTPIEARGEGDGARRLEVLSQFYHKNVRAELGLIRYDIIG